MRSGEAECIKEIQLCELSRPRALYRESRLLEGCRGLSAMLCCQNTIKALERHSTTNPALAKGWKRKNDDDKAEYLQEQKKHRKEKLASGATPSSIPYEFGDLTGEQSINHSAGQRFAVPTHFVNFRTWFLEEKVLEPDYKKDVALVDFKELITNAGNRALKVGTGPEAEWCLPMFRGAVAEDYTDDAFNHKVGRHRWD